MARKKSARLRVKNHLDIHIRAKYYPDLVWLWNDFASSEMAAECFLDYAKAALNLSLDHPGTYRMSKLESRLDPEMLAIREEGDGADIRKRIRVDSGKYENVLDFWVSRKHKTRCEAFLGLVRAIFQLVEDQGEDLLRQALHKAEVEDIEMSGGIQAGAQNGASDTPASEEAEEQITASADEMNASLLDSLDMG